MPDPQSRDEILSSAARSVAKVDLHGRRGLTLLSLDDIEALVLAVVILSKPSHQEKPQ